MIDLFAGLDRDGTMAKVAILGFPAILVGDYDTITAIDLPVASEWLIGLLIGHTVTPCFDGTRCRGKDGHTFLHGGEISDGKIGPFMGVIGVLATEKIAAPGPDIGIDQVNQPSVLSGIALNR